MLSFIKSLVILFTFTILAFVIGFFTGGLIGLSMANDTDEDLETPETPIPA